MKPLFPWLCAALLLGGCPDAKLPNPAPRVPEPKAVAPAPSGSPAGSGPTHQNR